MDVHGREPGPPPVSGFAVTAAIVMAFDAADVAPSMRRRFVPFIAEKQT